MVGTDLFELDKQQYIVVVDNFSRYPEAILLKSTTSSSIINAMKSVFLVMAYLKLSEVTMVLSIPLWNSLDSQIPIYGFKHVTSSLHFSQSNGMAEQMVQTVKNLLKKSNDPYMALLSYRSTPLTWCQLSPAELLMGRRIRSSVYLK